MRVRHFQSGNQSELTSFLVSVFSHDYVFCVRTNNQTIAVEWNKSINWYLKEGLSENVIHSESNKTYIDFFNFIAKAFSSVPIKITYGDTP